jgi:hypothetical protein
MIYYYSPLEDEHWLVVTIRNPKSAFFVSYEDYAGMFGHSNDKILMSELVTADEKNKLNFTDLIVIREATSENLHFFIEKVFGAREFRNHVEEVGQFFRSHD